MVDHDMTAAEQRRKKARALRYKKPALVSLNYDYMYETLMMISEACDDVRYYINDEGTLLNALDDDEEEELEFRMMYSDLSQKCEQLSSVIDYDFPEIFDDFFVGIMLKNRSPYKMQGFDSYEEDYFGLTSWEEEQAESDAFKRLMRLRKEDIIKEAGRCFSAAVLFLNIREEYAYLEAAFDVLLDKNTSYLQLLRDIDKAYETAEADEWYGESVSVFNELVNALPDKVWVE